MLPYNEWKALRIISFAIDGLQANFLYLRKFNLTDLKASTISDSNLIEKGNDSLNLPLDEIDKFLFNWFKVIDQNAMIQSKLLIFNSEVRDLNKYYSGFPTTMIQMLALPSFNIPTIEEINKYIGKSVMRYHREYKVAILGNLPKNKQLSIIGYYDYSKRQELEKFMDDLDKCIILTI